MNSLITLVQNLIRRGDHVKLVLLCLAFISGTPALAQKSGLIYKTAGTGASVLDPNADGYVSATTAGFTTSDYSESEIAYARIPQLSTEPSSDLATGPDCGFSDFVDDGSEFAAGSYFDGTNLMFRFRLGGTAENSKGYSILIDTDQKMGPSGEHADPNYVSGNPGFEIEVVLQTNFGVYLYNVDGTTTPTQMGSALAYADYCQKAIANNIYEGASCDNKYFYDFYIPFANITAQFSSITTSTPLRFVANTLIAPKSMLEGPISDIQGVDNDAYGSADLAWTATINNVYPTAATGISSGFGADRTTNVPTLGSPISPAATSVSVTTAVGGVIKVYVEGNSSPVCSTTVVSSGTHSVSGCTVFTAGQVVYATLTETGKTESARSNLVTVFSCSGTVTATPTGIATAQNEKKLVGSCVSGATVRLYQNGVFYGNATVTTTSWEYVFGTTGNGLIPCGTWQATAQSAGNCESALSEPYCQSNSSGGGAACATTHTTTASPTITTPIYSTEKQVTGTTTSGATVYLYINDIYQTSVVASSTTYTFTGLTLATSDVLTVRALGSGGSLCRSLAVSASVTQGVSIAPVVTGPILAGATTVYGSSVEPEGTTITVYVNGGSIGTATVQSDGTWSRATASLSAGNTVYATATATGKTVSANSATVTVAAAAASFAPVITSSPSQGATSISGTLPSGQATGTYKVALYLDGYQIAASGDISHTNGNTEAWSITGLSTSSTAENYLYSGGKLTATIFASSATVSSQGPESNQVTVSCTDPTDKTTNLSSAFLNDPGTVTVTVVSSEIGIIYTLTNSDGSTILGNSALGTGSDVTLTSDNLSSTTTLYVKADRIGTTCYTMLSGSHTVTVDVEAVYTNNTTIHPGTYTNGETIASVTDADGTITGASVSSGSLPSGTSLNSTTGAITVSDKTLMSPATYNFTVTTTDEDGGTTATPLEMTFNGAQLPVELMSFTAELKDGVVDLNWATAWEVNNSHFTIERSADGAHFEAIAKQAGAGTSFKVNTYYDVDRNPLQGVSYYRLKQTDYNGTESYSWLISIRNNTNITDYAHIEIYPNPASSPDIIVSMHGMAMATATMTITDDAGRVIARCIFNAESETQNMKLFECLNTELKPGTYTVIVTDGTVQLAERIVITR